MTEDGTLILPLLLLDRSAHVMIEAVTYDGRQLGRPIRARERKILEDGLRDRWSTAPEKVTSLFGKTIGSSRQRVPPIARYFGKDPDGHRFLRDCIREADAAGFSEEKKIQLFKDLRRWRRSFLMLVEVPLKWLEADQITIVLRYTENVPPFTVFKGGLPRLRPAFALLRKVIAGSLSWSVRVPARGVGDARSSHISLEAPPGFRVVDAALRVEEYIKGEVFHSWVRDDDRLSTSAHVYIDTTDRSFREIEFITSFYAYKSGFFIESLLSSWMLTALLAAFFVRMDSAGFDLTEAQFDSNFSASLVLLVPALVATILCQRDGHRVASRSFAFPRLLLLVSAITSVAAAAAMSVKADPDTAAIIWRASMLASALVAVRMTLGAIMHLLRLSRPRTAVVGAFRFAKDQRDGRMIMEHRSGKGG